MADYDSGEITARERKASQNQTAISKQNVKDVQNQLARQLSNYNFADAQNRSLADVQLKQNSRKTSADRFEAQRDLQAATLGLLGSMGTAMNGSTTGNLMSMLRSRNDKENNTYWAQHQTNQDSVENAYQDSVNQNRVARRDAMQSAEKAIRDIEGDWRANMNNINPNLFPGANSPVGNDDSLSSSTAWNANKAKKNNATISGYVIPDNKGKNNRPTGQANPANAMNVGAIRNRVRGGADNTVSGDYFSRLMNRFNGRTSPTNLLYDGVSGISDAVSSSYPINRLRDGVNNVVSGDYPTNRMRNGVSGISDAVSSDYFSNRLRDGVNNIVGSDYFR